MLEYWLTVALVCPYPPAMLFTGARSHASEPARDWPDWLNTWEREGPPYGEHHNTSKPVRLDGKTAVGYTRKMELQEPSRYRRTPCQILETCPGLRKSRKKRDNQLAEPNRKPEKCSLANTAPNSLLGRVKEAWSSNTDNRAGLLAMVVLDVEDERQFLLQCTPCRQVAYMLSL